MISRLAIVTSIVCAQVAQLTAGQFFLEYEGQKRKFGPFSDEPGSTIQVANAKLKVVDSGKPGFMSLKSLQLGSIVGPFKIADGSKVKLGAYDLTIRLTDETSLSPKEQKPAINVLDGMKEPVRAESDPAKVVENGDKQLIEAARNGNLATIKMLIAAGADVNAIVPGHEARGCKHTPLLFACAKYVKDLTNSQRLIHGRPAGIKSSLEPIELLLENNANPNTIAYCGKSGTPLRVAADVGALELTELLLKHGAKVQFNNDTRTSALVAAVAEGHADVTKLLLGSGGADLGLTHPSSGWQILHYAAIGGHKDVIDALLKAGAHPNAKCKSGTPMEVSVRYGTTREMTAAYKQRGIAFQAESSPGTSVLNQIGWAFAKGDMPAAKKLIKANPELLNEPGRNHATVLQVAIRLSPIDQDEKKKLLAWLVDAGLDLKRPGLLHEQLETRSAWFDVLVFLVESGVDPNMTDKGGTTPLRKAKSSKSIAEIYGYGSIEDLKKAIDYLESKTKGGSVRSSHGH